MQAASGSRTYLMINLVIDKPGVSIWLFHWVVIMLSNVLGGSRLVEREVECGRRPERVRERTVLW